MSQNQAIGVPVLLSESLRISQFLFRFNVFENHFSDISAAMLRSLVLCFAVSFFCLLEVDGRFSMSGFKRIQNNFLKRADPTRMLKTGSSVTSLYVGGTGIWWRSGVIASISQMEQGEKEKAMESLNIAIATLIVFDTTQATVSPVASELIEQLVKHKGKFPNTFSGLTNYNKEGN